MNAVVLYSIQQWKKDGLGPISRADLDTQACIDLPRSIIFVNHTRVFNLHHVFGAMYRFMPDTTLTLMLTQMVHAVAMKELHEEHGSRFVMSGTSRVDIHTKGGVFLSCTACVGQTPFVVHDNEVTVLHEKTFRLMTHIEDGIVSIYIE